MSETSTKRLPKAERREQLLETALAIVRDEGTDALTLGYVAERAGVSKPIAYEHFNSRSGLLIALYRKLDERHSVALLAALERTRPRLKDVAGVIGRAFMECYTAVGPEWHTISAAMKGDEEMEASQAELMDEYVKLYCTALAPYCDLPKDELFLRCIGIIGAGEAIAQAMHRGRTDGAAAAASLASLIVRWLSPQG